MKIDDKFNAWTVIKNRRTGGTQIPRFMPLYLWQRKMGKLFRTTTWQIKIVRVSA